MTMMSANVMYHEVLEEANTLKSEYEAKLINANDCNTNLPTENEALKEKVGIIFKLGRSYLNREQTNKSNNQLTAVEDVIEVYEEDTDVHNESLEVWITKKLRGFKRTNTTNNSKNHANTNLPRSEKRRKGSTSFL